MASLRFWLCMPAAYMAAVVSLRVTAAAEEAFLNDSELKAMLTNTVRTGQAADGTPWEIVSSADGTQKIVAGKDKGFRDAGKYIIRSGASCETWGKIAQGKEVCWRFKKTGDNQYASIKSDGKQDSIFSIKPQ
jgi:hypothetical protein